MQSKELVTQSRGEIKPTFRKSTPTRKSSIRYGIIILSQCMYHTSHNSTSHRREIVRMKDATDEWRRTVAASWEEKLNSIKQSHDRDNQIRGNDHKAQITELQRSMDAVSEALRESEKERHTLSKREAAVVVKEQVIQDLSEQLVNMRVRLQQCDNEAQTLRRTVANLTGEKESLQEQLQSLRKTIDEKDITVQYISCEIESIKSDYNKRIETLTQTLQDEHIKAIAALKANLKEAATALMAQEQQLTEKKRESEEFASAIKALMAEKENVRELSEQRLKKLAAIGTMLTDN